MDTFCGSTDNQLLGGSGLDESEALARLVDRQLAGKRSHCGDLSRSGSGRDPSRLGGLDSIVRAARATELTVSPSVSGRQQVLAAVGLAGRQASLGAVGAARKWHAQSGPARRLGGLPSGHLFAPNRWLPFPVGRRSVSQPVSQFKLDICAKLSGEQTTTAAAAVTKTNKKIAKLNNNKIL